MQRNSTYREFEAHDKEHCRMYKAADMEVRNNA